MTGRLAKTFADGRKKLVTFIMAGDPDHNQSLALMKALPEAGADVIELGMPFTDPVADGPIIQASGLRALAAGAGMKKTLAIVQEFRSGNGITPVVLMGYANPVMAYGWAEFASDAAAAGVDGFIIVDLPPEEDSQFRALCTQQGLDLIRLITPTSDDERLARLLDGAGGFLYYVSVTGITGAARPDLGVIGPHLEKIRSETDLKLAIGFGVKTPEDARTMASLGDAVVVGSAIVSAMHTGGVEAASLLVQNLAQALK